MSERWASKTPSLKDFRRIVVKVGSSLLEERRRRFSCTASALMELDACRSAVADFPK